MKVYQQSPEHTPHLFFLPRDTGEVQDIYDQDGNIIGTEPVLTYDIPVKKTQHADHLLLERKSKKGVQALKMFLTTTELWDNDILIAEQWVKLEVSEDNGTTWFTPTAVSKTVDSDNDGLVDAIVTTSDGSELRVNCTWVRDDGKQTFSVTSPGKLVRVKWIIKAYDPDNAMLFDYTDYSGNVSYELLEDAVDYDLFEVVFEPNGVMNTLVVDPYIANEETATEIKITWDSGDTATWTIATENAYVQDSSSVITYVRDDVCQWTATEYKLIRYKHGTGTAGSGLLVGGTGLYLTTANLTQVGSTEMYFYPADSATNTNKAAIATQLADTVLPIYEGDGTTAAEITDFNIPTSIGSNGFRSDGSWVFDVDTNQQAKFTADIDRDNMSLAIPNWEMKTVNDAGDGFDEHLICQWDCESTTINIPSGKTATVTGSYATLSTDDPVQGINSLKLSGNHSWFEIPIVSQDIFNKTNGTINFAYKNTGYNRTFLRVWDINNLILEIRSSTTNNMRATWYDGSASQSISIDNVNYYNIWDIVSVAWDTSEGILVVIISGEIVGSVNINPTTLNPTRLTIGDVYYDWAFIAYIDNLKIYNKAILPYGAYYTGIGSGSTDLTAVNADVAHSDVTMYTDDGSTLDIGTTSITDISNISATDGSVLMDCNVATSLTADEVLFSAGSGTTLEVKYVHASTNITFTHGTTTITSAAVTSGLDGRHIISAHYTASGEIRLMVDGIEVTGTSGVAPTLASSITWSSNVGMTRQTITSDKDTPQIPTAGYKPIVLPVLDKG